MQKKKHFVFIEDKKKHLYKGIDNYIYKDKNFNSKNGITGYMKSEFNYIQLYVNHFICNQCKIICHTNLYLLYKIAFNLGLIKILNFILCYLPL